MKIHHVKNTDTIEGIALAYQVSVEKLKKVNKIYNNNDLFTREKIVIPQEEGETVGSSLSPLIPQSSTDITNNRN
eukprot:jgi/Orpsp1_1/1180706/evm.model.c7180000074379.1